jgi:hypothetical protein
MDNFTERLLQARQDWINNVRKAWMKIELVNEYDEVKIPEKQWKALDEAITKEVVIPIDSPKK